MEIGNTLREARRARGLTLEEVEEETKIRKKYIMAMEMEQFEVLPGSIYAKAFLKNYAKFLDISPDEIMYAFKLKQAGETAQEETDKQVAEKKIAAKRAAGKKVTVKRKPPYWLYAAAALLLVAVVASLVYGTRGLWSNVAVNEGQQQNTDKITAQDNTGQQQVPVQDNTANITGVKIVLNAISDRCWVLAIVDGKEAFQGELTAGESESFEGTENIIITLGNAGVVEVLENDKSLGSLGAVGDVVEREFKAPATQ